MGGVLPSPPIPALQVNIIISYFPHIPTAFSLIFLGRSIWLVEAGVSS